MYTTHMSVEFNANNVVNVDHIQCQFCYNSCYEINERVHMSLLCKHIFYFIFFNWCLTNDKNVLFCFRCVCVREVKHHRCEIILMHLKTHPICMLNIENELNLIKNQKCFSKTMEFQCKFELAHEIASIYGKNESNDMKLQW